jgi:hypothetical protein
MSGKAARSVFFANTLTEASKAADGLIQYLEGNFYAFQGRPILAISDYQRISISTCKDVEADQARAPELKPTSFDWFDWQIESIPEGDPNRLTWWAPTEGWRAFPPERLGPVSDRPNPRLVDRTLMGLFAQIWGAEPKGVS